MTHDPQQPNHGSDRSLDRGRDPAPAADGVVVPGGGAQPAPAAAGMPVTAPADVVAMGQPQEAGAAAIVVDSGGSIGVSPDAGAAALRSGGAAGHEQVVDSAIPGGGGHGAEQPRGVFNAGRAAAADAAAETLVHGGGGPAPRANSLAGSVYAGGVIGAAQPAETVAAPKVQGGGAQAGSAAARSGAVIGGINNIGSTGDGAAQVPGGGSIQGEQDAAARTGEPGGFGD